MPKPTAKQVDEERKALQHIKKYVPTLDRYRVNRHNLIDAQVQTLKWGFTLEEIKKTWPNETNGDERGAAEDALYWKQGGKVFSPMEGWLILLKSLEIEIPSRFQK